MIELKNLSFAYQGSSKHGGLSDINLTIADKECVLLCGRSGCGKTSLIRLINGLIPSFYPGDLNGEVSIDRQSVQGVPMYKLANKVGSVFQNPRSQFFNIDTDSEIVFGMENLSWDLHCMQERLEETIDDLKIENLIGRKVSELSGGEKQKIAFASIYALSPNIYLLDEPSSNLDMPAITGLRQVLSFLKEKLYSWLLTTTNSLFPLVAESCIWVMAKL